MILHFKDHAHVYTQRYEMNVKLYLMYNSIDYQWIKKTRVKLAFLLTQF